MNREKTKAIALGGLLAAVAMVIMCLGGMIPIATYVCPMLCAIVQFLVLQFCGRRIAWVWYVAVSLLSILIGPDKEAAGVFVLLGYYPIVKPALDHSRLRWLWKLMLFNGAVALMYLGLIHLLGLSSTLSEFRELGRWGLVAMLLMGNVVFFLLDLVLNMMQAKFSRR